MVRNIDTAQEIWGKDISALNGKTVWGKPIVVASDCIKIPKDIDNLKKTECLTAEMFFVNRILFFISLNIKMDFSGVSHLKWRTAAIIFDAFKGIFRLYLQQGFRIQTVHKDGEFGALKYLIENIPAGLRVNLTSTNEHVPEIERHIRVVKERSQEFCHSIPFNRIQKLMTIHAVLKIANMLNYFPLKRGISLDLSSRSILTGESLN